MPGYVWRPSGSHLVIYEYANRLSLKGYEVHIIFPRQLKISKSIRLTIRARLRNMLRKIILNPKPQWFNFNEKVKLSFVPELEEIYIPNADVIFATWWGVAEYINEYPIDKGIKFYLIQEYEAETQKYLKNRIDKTWRMPFYKIVISDWLKEKGQAIGIHDLIKIPNGIDHQKYKVLVPVDKRPLRVAMCYVPTPRKDPETGIRALNIAKARYPSLQAVLFGVSKKSSLIPSWIEYYRDPPQKFIIEKIYNDSIIFLSSSYAEAFGLTPAEAMACGCAVVSTDYGGIREYAEHGFNALLSEPRNSESLAANLCSFIKDNDMRIKMAIAGLQSIIKLNWDQSTNQLESFILDKTKCND